jgi:DNA-binding NarL/FixJ family response regulator
MRIAIAEDSGFFRDALADALESLGVNVSAKVDNIPSLFEAIAVDEPDVVVLDVCLPPTKTDEGLVAAETLARTSPHIGVLVLSAHLGMPHVARLLSASDRGIGCLSKDQLHDADMLMAALTRIADGGTFVDPQFVEARFRMDSVTASLTPRELEIMRALAQGLSNQGIASHLHVNVKTVESAITSIFRKFNLEGNETNARVCAVLTFLGQSNRPRS